MLQITSDNIVVCVLSSLKCDVVCTLYSKYVISGLSVTQIYEKLWTYFTDIIGLYVLLINFACDCLNIVHIFRLVHSLRLSFYGVRQLVFIILKFNITFQILYMILCLRVTIVCCLWCNKTSSGGQVCELHWKMYQSEDRIYFYE